jgi:transcriptional regulator GlxA family with amidase domain
VLSVGIGVATFGALAAAGIATSAAQGGVAPRSAEHVATPQSPPTGALNVAVVLGRSGTDTADALVPFEVFSSSPAFTVYTVAEAPTPAPLEGGLAVVPSYTFAQVAAGAAPVPDVVVVPAVSEPDDPVEQGAREFLSRQYHAGVRLLGICAGARLLSASGVLDGLRATSHWSRISALQTSRPAVDWIRGERYVQDGRVTTTGGVTSGFWGSLKVMADLAGPAEAERVGRLVDYPGWSLGGSTAMPAQSFSAGDLTVLGNTSFPWGRPDIDVQLKDGVDEVDAAAVFEVYNYSQAGATVARSASGRITTRHGLVVLTAATGPSTPDAIIPGHLVSAGGRHGFDAAFEQLSRSTSPTVVRSVAKMLEYPLDRDVLDTAPLPLRWRPITLFITAIALGVAAGITVFPGRRRRSRG